MSQPKGESGWPTAASAQETRAADSARGDDPTIFTPTPLSDSQGSSTSGIDHGRFAPGTVLGDRYRIVELLGRGGMGEVYRVDDLRLGQPVSLKFLTARLGGSHEGLGTLYQEARAARLVGHPNTCRVFDVGEIDGVPFISMEYVDGENLKSLLNRIGRLPHAKAVEIAQQLCRGLHAVHEQGLLHRDLKPTNIMIDGRGRARITDFGLAGATQNLLASSERAGTPAYMAPEQLAGRGLSVRSDVYALGLILYEVFTGRRTFDGRTWAEYARLHTESTPRAPSALVDELDPVVERVILRCLAKDPQERPASALAVLAALPGGDPLAEAIAAGETPSPELVAAAQTPGRMAPLWVGLCGLLVVLGLGLIAWVYDHYSPLRAAPLDLPPAVLQERARDIIRAFGYARLPADSKGAFDAAHDMVQYVKEHDTRPDRWQRAVKGPVPVISYWYRQAAAPLTARGAQGVVSWEDPAPTVPGMVGVLTDAQGHLRRFYAVPPDHEAQAPTRAGEEPTWDVAFRLAGLSLADFVADASTWVPPVYGDVRRAWRQRASDTDEVPLCVEASAYDGRITTFAVLGPWARPYAPDQAAPEVLHWATAIIVVVLLLTGSLLTFHNLRQGRGDRRGGLVAAGYLFALSFLAWAVQTDSISSFAYVLDALIKALGAPAFFAGSFWLLYMALEPYLRRRWPHRLVGWTRVLSGRWRDPLVGRDVLAGLVLGTAAALVTVLTQVAPLWLGRPPANNFAMLQAVETLTPRAMLALLLQIPVIAVFNGLIFVFVPLLFFILVRIEWLAGIFALLFWTLWIDLFSMGGPDDWMLRLAYGIVLASLWTTAALRFGLLTTTIMFMTLFLLQSVSLTLDFSAWYAPSVSLAALAVLVLTAAACHVALGGRMPRLALLDA